jgi:hypothetical protein
MADLDFARPDAPGTLYLLHYSGETAHGHQHYLGWSGDLEERTRQQRPECGANDPMQAVAEGLALTIAQTWTGTPELQSRVTEWVRAERTSFAGLCPYCPGGKLPPADLARELGEPSLVRHTAGHRQQYAAVSRSFHA